jgi:hypothetical protein
MRDVGLPNFPTVRPGAFTSLSRQQPGRTDAMRIPTSLR